MSGDETLRGLHKNKDPGKDDISRGIARNAPTDYGGGLFGCKRLILEKNFADFLNFSHSFGIV